MLSSAFSILLLNPATRVFIFVIVLLSSKISIWFHLYSLLEKEMATHSSTLSMGSQRVGYDRSNSARMRINSGYGGRTFSPYHMACRSFNPQVFPVSSLWGFGKHRRQTAESSGQNHRLSYEANSSLIPSSTTCWPSDLRQSTHLLWASHPLLWKEDSDTDHTGLVWGWSEIQACPPAQHHWGPCWRDSYWAHPPCTGLRAGCGVSGGEQDRAMPSSPSSSKSQMINKKMVWSGSKQVSRWRMGRGL